MRDFYVLECKLISQLLDVLLAMIRTSNRVFQIISSQVHSSLKLLVLLAGVDFFVSLGVDLSLGWED